MAARTSCTQTQTQEESRKAQAQEMKYKVKQGCKVQLKDRVVLAGEIISPRKGTSDLANIGRQRDCVKQVDSEPKSKPAKLKAPTQKEN